MSYSGWNSMLVIYFLVLCVDNCMCCPSEIVAILNLSNILRLFSLVRYVIYSFKTIEVRWPTSFKYNHVMMKRVNWLVNIRSEKYMLLYSHLYEKIWGFIFWGLFIYVRSSIIWRQRTCALLLPWRLHWPFFIVLVKTPVDNNVVWILILLSIEFL